MEPLSETKADPHSHGFRAGRATADAIAARFNFDCLTDTLRNKYTEWLIFCVLIKTTDLSKHSFHVYGQDKSGKP
ncbi:hypothetical protein CCS41_10595 [Candidatus Fukatsuia symbiotica]|uniref:Uncharacterized protein n=1 Tax=Candidatus Fukatsuia symbiotica TaxID=1878942 RepID=A0A2U8I6L6_9GAMM|nr:hypothetical protein CCS41_10595 [Candidatus Fukatsuia symbiotica]